MAEASRYGNQYGPIFNFGGRSQQGNTYYNYGSSSDEQALLSILQSLEYPGMDDRRDALTEAESGTFEWALAKEEQNFVTDREVDDDGEMYTQITTIDINFTSWLEGEEGGLFCFMGKPGSGKSTLIKFLATDSKVDRALERWGNEKKVVRSEHYFWILGTSMQKTCEGMLRSLLHSLLQSMRSADDEGFDRMKRAYGTRRSSNNSRRAWNCDDLHQMLARLTSGSTTKFFLLIDALDECEPQDRPEKIAAEVLKISRLPNVKLCISCRPWESFASRFPPTRTLLMDRLTYRDMELYVESRLTHASSSNHLCAEFRDKTTESQKFLSEIVRAAEGVFLWIELVLNELCSELRKGRELEQLRNTLARFPVGLDRYFERFVLDRITRTSQSYIDTAAALKLALEIAESTSRDGQDKLKPCPDSFLNFWLLRGGHLKPDLSWKDHSGSWYLPEDVRRMVAKTRSFLEESCKDLLVLVDKRGKSDDWAQYYSEMEWDVRFLHRTVADFLRDNHTVSSAIKEHSPAHFTDNNLLDDLRKMRCLHLLHEMQACCAIAEQDFVEALRPQTWTQDDIDFVSVCDTRMTQRFEEACGCTGTVHLQGDMIRTCASTGSTRYALAVLKSRPHVAICLQPFQASLKGAVFGYLELVNFTTGSATSGCLDLCSPIAGSLYRPPAQQNRIQHKHGLFSYLSPLAVTNPSVKLIDNLLACGGDPNATPIWSASKCPNTVWEIFLREVCQKVHRCEQETDTLEQPGNLDGMLQGYKRKVRDLIAIFLWHGASPKCMPCIAEHSDGVEPCKRTSLQDISPYSVPHEEIAMINEMQVMRSKDFEPLLSQRGQRLRAIRSWLQSEQSFVAHAGRRHDRDQSRTEDEWFLEQGQFLRGLTGIIGRGACDKCLLRDYLYGAMWCVDCNGRYSVCDECTKEIIPEISSGKVLMGKIIHEKIPLVEGHTSIAFGFHPYAPFGIRESISVLKEWYAKNSVEPDSGVD